ncbi:MAG: hypothetical protein ACI8YQ_003420 [Polaribacter sp.]|jgi:hypothetical protein
MKTILTLILAVASYTLFSQVPSKHSLFLDASYSFNKDVSIAGIPVEGSRGTNVTIGGTYRIFRYKKFQTELGLAAKTIFASGKRNNKSFSATTLRLGMPLNLTLAINQKWTISSGFFLQNNVDLSEFDLRLRDKYSWRVNFIPELRYTFYPLWQVNLKGHFNMRDMADAYLINDPAIGFSVGVSRSFFIIGKPKT